jgi:SRSO17 transposase
MDMTISIIGIPCDGPKSWTDDRDRCRAAHIPDDRVFATKPDLAEATVLRAIASPLPIAWVTADAAYGQERRLRRMLEETGLGYVLAVPKSRQVPALRTHRPPLLPGSR